MTQCKMVYRPAAKESVSDVVVRGIADAKCVDPIDLDVRLYDYIDPCALDRLFDVNKGFQNARVSFTMAGYRIDIEKTRKVVLTPLNGSPVTESEARA